jgi:murein DD-endopeptidase MepM/ murein hydrolase activator NlpD
MAEQGKKSFAQKIKSKYRLVLYNDSTYEEALSFRLSRLNVFAYFGSVIILLIFLIILLVAYTPLRELIPHVPDGKLQQNIIMNAVRIDSLDYRLKTRDLYYLDNIKRILSDQEPVSFLEETDSVSRPEDITFSKSAYDSILRKEIEAADQFALSLTQSKDKNKGIEYTHFFNPLSKGIVNNAFDPSTKHFGVDIVSELNEGVKSTLDGTVILATWTLTTGHVIQIQHPNNLVSVYKHNAVLFKEQGDKVKAGEVIAIIGNSGEQTTGPHLHFELWYNGTPVNPEDYIVF